MQLRTVRIAAFVVVIVMLVIAQRLGVFRQLGDLESMTRTLRGLGAWGYVAFILAYAAFQPFGIPGTAFVLAAALIWTWPVAFGLSMVGTMAASVLGFSFARFVARDWLAAIVPARFRKYDDALARRAFTTVLVLRFVFWMPPLLHVFFGVSKVRFWTHFWASFVGYLVPLFLMSFFGQRVFDAMKNAPLGVWVALAACVLAIVIVAWSRQRQLGHPRLKPEPGVAQIGSRFGVSYGACPKRACAHSPSTSVAPASKPQSSTRRANRSTNASASKRLTQPRPPRSSPRS